MRRRVAWSLVFALSAVSSTVGGQPQRLPPNVRPQQPTLPGGAQPISPGALPTAPVRYRLGSSATTATDASFVTSLTGTSFEWNFGGAAIPNTATSTTSTSPTVVLARPGTYTVTVTARGTAAAPSTASHSVTVNPFTVTRGRTIDRSTSRGEDDIYTLLPSPAGDVSLVQCAYDGAKWTRLFARRGGTWTPFDVTAHSTPKDPGYAAACNSPLAALGTDGMIRFIALRSPTRVAYFAARTAVPDGPAGWTESLVTDALPSGVHPVFALRSDRRPVVAFRSATGGASMKLLMANSAAPAGPGDWSAVSPAPFFGTDIAIATNRDAPAVLFTTRFEGPDPNNGVRLAYATTTNPRTAADFRVMTLPRPPAAARYGGDHAALFMYEGRFVAVYHELGGIRIVRATVEAPTTMADFTASFIEDHVDDSRMYVATTIQTFQGRLVVSYSTSSAQRIAVARTHAPAGPADWEVFTASPHEFPNFSVLATSDGSRAPFTTAYWIASSYGSLGDTGVLSDTWR